MHCFAGNMLQVQNQEGRLFLVMSETAFGSLNNDQMTKLKSYNELIVVAVPTIEKIWRRKRKMHDGGSILKNFTPEGKSGLVVDPNLSDF